MSAIVEEICNERALSERRKIARAIILTGKLSCREIADGTGLPVDEVEKMAMEEKMHG